jgi:hypothetical protein
MYDNGMGDGDTPWWAYVGGGLLFLLISIGAPTLAWWLGIGA